MAYFWGINKVNNILVADDCHAEIKARDDLILALLGEFLETCDHIGLTYYEERAEAWLKLLGIDREEHISAWNQQTKVLSTIFDEHWKPR